MNTCPFCGSSDVVNSMSFWQGEIDLFYIKCENCGSCGPVVEKEDTDSNEIEKAAILWNERK
jgi:Lar family restriction alleviation protein